MRFLRIGSTRCPYYRLESGEYCIFGSRGAIYLTHRLRDGSIRLWTEKKEHLRGVVLVEENGSLKRWRGPTVGERGTKKRAGFGGYP